MTAVFLALIFPCMTGLFARAEEVLAPAESSYVSVTVAEENGTPALVYADILLRDADGDGVLTVYDALLGAHDAHFDGGAAAGFSAEQTEGGLTATCLWGTEGGGFGFYVNHTAVNDLLFPVQDGDLLYAFVRADAGGEPDLYCYFDASRASVSGGEELTLTLTAAGFDEEGQPAVLPVSDAVIRIDGRDTFFTTDAEGRVTLQFDGSGYCVVSARKDGVALVPPVCAVTVSIEEPFAGERGALLRWIAVSAVSLAGIAAVLRSRRRRADRL